MPLRIDADMVVEAAVLDGDDGLLEVLGHVGGRELRALEDAARREGLAVLRLDHQGARRRVDLQAAVQGQSRDAVADHRDEQESEDAGDDEDVARSHPSNRTKNDAAGPDRCAPGSRP